MEARASALERQLQETEEFADAVRLMEEAEQRKLEAEEREKRRLQEERERIKREKQLAEERARQEEEERLRQEALLQEKLRQEQDEKDTAATQIYLDEVAYFLNILPVRLALREEDEMRRIAEQEQREVERQRRLAARTVKN